ncbi:MAG: pyridoxamine 5'-phosphate oxidase family protein [Rhizobiaceae bacterium]
MSRAFADITFTPAVISMQTELGSAENYADFLAPDTEAANLIGPAEAEFIGRMDGFFQATVSETGWPYVQFRGGRPGFLQVLDPSTIAYADFRGNRQYLSTGNLSADDRVSLILVDYPNRRRLKIWGHAKLIDRRDDPDLVSRLRVKGYRALPERAVVISVAALDWNCPQHIPQRMTIEEMAPHLQPLHAEIARLEQENSELKQFLGQNS